AAVDIERDVAEHVTARIKERLNRKRRLIVEQDDQLLADMNQRDLLFRNIREIELDVLVVAEVDRVRLARIGLDELDEPSGSGGTRSGAANGGLRENNRLIHWSCLC